MNEKIGKWIRKIEANKKEPNGKVNTKCTAMEMKLTGWAFK